MKLSFTRDLFVVLMSAATGLWFPGCTFTKATVESDGGTGSGTWEGTGGSGRGTIGIVPPSTIDEFNRPDAAGCASQTAEATVLPVNLVFAFDVSGSLGKGDFPWHDRTLKWDPMVAATRAFLTDPASAGFTASLTFFPSLDSKCEDASYLVPAVALTPLPSPAFGAAIDALGTQLFQGRTPTLHVVRAVIAQATAAAQVNPGRYVIVLVTDGYPEGCPDNDVASVAAVVAAVAGQFRTYVIGVKNPPLTGAPDTVSNLTAIAQAGGTGNAYIIDTGDPAKTTAAFKTTIDSIRGNAVSCIARIPRPPAGSVFEKEKVAVTANSHGMMTKLGYDPTCAADNSWHYDSATAPTTVVLCPSTCNIVQADPAASLKIEFTCTKVIIVIP